MIQEFVNNFMKHEQDLKAQWAEELPHSYVDIVKTVVSNIGSDDYGDPDPEKVHVIDDGDYQGTLLFVIPAQGYQPFDYWYVKVSYGSCSGCDTLQAITEGSYYGDRPTQQQVDDIWTLALHVVQGIKSMD